MTNQVVEPEQYIANPTLKFVVDDTAVIIENPFYNLQMRGSSALKRLFDFAKKPRAIRDFVSEFGAESGFLDSLVSNYYLIPVQASEYLMHGLSECPVSPVGDFQPLWSARKDVVASAQFALLGVPSDLGGEFGGAREGPRLVRSALNELDFPKVSLSESYGLTSQDVIDYEFNRRICVESAPLVDIGDVRCNIGEPLRIVGGRVTTLVNRCLDAGLKPVIIGGDHSYTYYSILAIQNKYESFGIFHFDAHHDCYRSGSRQQSHLDHGNVIEHCLRLPGVKSVMQIGLRTLEMFMPEPYLEQDCRVSAISARMASRSSPADIFEALPRGLPYYVSFDLDAMEIFSAFETGTPVVGGLSYYSALEYLDYIFQNFNVVGADFMELRRSEREYNEGARRYSRFISNFILSKSRHTAIFPLNA